VRERLVELSEALALVKRVRAKRDAVYDEVAFAQSVLDALLNAPVSGGRDPFEWLPDELVENILVMLPLATLHVERGVPCSACASGGRGSWKALQSSSGVCGRAKGGLRTSLARSSRGSVLVTQVMCGHLQKG
jgi:hypothetical protein